MEKIIKYRVIIIIITPRGSHHHREWERVCVCVRCCTAAIDIYILIRAACWSCRKNVCVLVPLMDSQGLYENLQCAAFIIVPQFVCKGQLNAVPADK